MINFKLITLSFWHTFGSVGERAVLDFSQFYFHQNCQFLVNKSER